MYNVNECHDFFHSWFCHLRDVLSELVVHVVIISNQLLHPPFSFLLCPLRLVHLYLFVVFDKQVGSGKSSLLNLVLGEMRLISGSVHSSGSIAYVPQVRKLYDSIPT